MTGFEIVKKSVTDITSNMTDALAISALPWIALTALDALIVAPVRTEAVASETVNVFPILLVMAFSLFVTLWVAVEWHRFILLGERATSVFPRLQMDLIGQYFMISLVVSLVLMVAIMVYGTALLFVAQLVFPAALQLISSGFGILLFSLPAFYLFFRLSPALPAVAIGGSIKLKEAWKMTAPIKKDVFNACIILVLAQSFLFLSMFALGNGVLFTLGSLVTGWISMMVGVGVLATIFRLASGEENHG